jgi:hypothetical protein
MPNPTGKSFNRPDDDGDKTKDHSFRQRVSWVNGLHCPTPLCVATNPDGCKYAAIFDMHSGTASIIFIGRFAKYLEICRRRIARP